MDRDFLLIAILLIVNLVIAVVYLVYHLRKRDRKKGVLIFFFILVVPIVGFSFLLLAELMNFALHQEKSHILNLSELSFSQQRIRVLTDADVEKELNRVPIEEALLVSDKQNKRQAFIDLLKRDDYEESIPAIQGAVENADMEVSHYAASFLTDIRARYKGKEAEYRRKVDEDPSEANLKAYTDYMEKTLQRNVFSSVELKVYVDIFDQCAKMLYEMNPEALNDHTIVVIADLWRKLGNMDRVEPWVERSRGRSRDSLESFKLCANYYYYKGERDKFFELLSEVKRFSVPLDNEALEWIRFFK